MTTNIMVLGPLYGSGINGVPQIDLNMILVVT